MMAAASGLKSRLLTRGIHGKTLFDEAGVKLPAHEAVRIHQALVEGDIGAHANHLIFLQGTPHPQDGFGAGLAPDDQLGDQRIVVGGDLKARVNAGIDAHTGPGGQRIWVICPVDGRKLL